MCCPGLEKRVVARLTRSFSSQHWFVQRFPDQIAAARPVLGVAYRRIVASVQRVGWAAKGRLTALGWLGFDVLCALLGLLERAAADVARKMPQTENPESLMTGRCPLETLDLMNLLATVVGSERPTRRMADPGKPAAGSANLVVGMASSAHRVSEVAGRVGPVEEECW